MKFFPLPSDPKIIIMPVRIAGPVSERYVRVILDTGATFTMLCPEVLEEVGYELGKPFRRAAITTASSVEDASFYMISGIEVLGNRIENIEVASHKLPERVPADGLLGLNVLKYFDLHLEFLRKRMRFDR